MASVLAPLVYALFIWWFSTGVILYLSGLPRRTWKVSLAAATTLAVWSLAALYLVRDDATAWGAYTAFTAAVLLWAWHEVTFLLGAVTGPRTAVCPENCSGWARFIYATQAILWHELAIVATLALTILVTGDGANQVGVWTFALLWIMRLSAKLNLFLGVPKTHAELLPHHLEFMGSYFRTRTMNGLFPVSITAGTVATVLIVQMALEGSGYSATRIGGLLVAALLGLAVVEHWFMVVPVEDTALWRWALRARDAVKQRRGSTSDAPDRRPIAPWLKTRARGGRVMERKWGSTSPVTR